MNTTTRPVAINEPDTDLLGERPHDAGGRSKPQWPAGSLVTAEFGGPGDCYRYRLSEIWDASKPMVMFLLMNPSVAGPEHADPTLNKTGNFARSWGYGGQFVGNVHAYRATHHRRLREVADPVGPGNDAALLWMAARSRIIVLAYGKPHVSLRGRAHDVVLMLRQVGAGLSYLEMSLDRTPKHPLYLPAHLTPLDYPAP